MSEDAKKLLHYVSNWRKCGSKEGDGTTCHHTASVWAEYIIAA
jgi:hypothetical protein